MVTWITGANSAGVALLFLKHHRREDALFMEAASFVKLILEKRRGKRKKPEKRWQKLAAV